MSVKLTFSMAGMKLVGMFPPMTTLSKAMSFPVSGSGSIGSMCHNFGVLTGASGLLLVRVSEIRALSDNLTECYMRFASDAISVVLSAHVKFPNEVLPCQK
jgi:hypothetical protein